MRRKGRTSWALLTVEALLLFSLHMDHLAKELHFSFHIISKGIPQSHLPPQFDVFSSSAFLNLSPLVPLLFCVP